MQGGGLALFWNSRFTASQQRCTPDRTELGEHALVNKPQIPPTLVCDFSAVPAARSHSMLRRRRPTGPAGPGREGSPTDLALCVSSVDPLRSPPTRSTLGPFGGGGGLYFPQFRWDPSGLGGRLARRAARQGMQEMQGIASG